MDPWTELSSLIEKWERESKRIDRQSLIYDVVWALFGVIVVVAVIYHYAVTR